MNKTELLGMLGARLRSGIRRCQLSFEDDHFVTSGVMRATKDRAAKSGGRSAEGDDCLSSKSSRTSGLELAGVSNHRRCQMSFHLHLRLTVGARGAEGERRPAVWRPESWSKACVPAAPPGVWSLGRAEDTEGAEVSTWVAPLFPPSRKPSTHSCSRPCDTPALLVPERVGPRQVKVLSPWA